MWLAFLLSKWDRKECSIHRKEKVNITLWNFCFRYMRVSYMPWVMMTMWFLTEDRTKNMGRQLYDLQLIRDSSPRKYCESLKVRTLWRHFTYYFSKPWAWSWHLTLLQHSHWWGGERAMGHPCAELILDASTTGPYLGLSVQLWRIAITTPVLQVEKRSLTIIFF